MNYNDVLVGHIQKKQMLKQKKPTMKLPTKADNGLEVDEKRRSMVQKHPSEPLNITSMFSNHGKGSNAKDSFKSKGISEQADRFQVHDENTTDSNILSSRIDQPPSTAGKVNFRGNPTDMLDVISEVIDGKYLPDDSDISDDMSHKIDPKLNNPMDSA